MTENLIHKVLENSRSIFEAEWHELPLVESTVGTESGLRFGVFREVDLVETLVGIKGGEPFQAVELQEDIINTGKRVLVSHCDLVDIAIINAETVFTMLLDKDSWRSPWRVCFLNDALVKEFSELFIDGGTALG